MRLIDLNQTVFVPIVDESKGGVSYEMQMSLAEFFDKFLDGFKPEIVDAVPVVRCRDCKYWYAEIGASTSWLPCQEIATDRNWFCASGKQRDTQGERDA